MAAAAGRCQTSMARLRERVLEAFLLHLCRHRAQGECGVAFTISLHAFVTCARAFPPVQT